MSPPLVPSPQPGTTRIHYGHVRLRYGVGYYGCKAPFSSLQLQSTDVELASSPGLEPNGSANHHRLGRGTVALCSIATRFPYVRVRLLAAKVFCCVNSKYDLVNNI